MIYVISISVSVMCVTTPPGESSSLSVEDDKR
jgi:hypothetical protein